MTVTDGKVQTYRARVLLSFKYGSREPRLPEAISISRIEPEVEMARTKIVIVYAGFGGLAAAKALKNTPAEITDRSHKPPPVSTTALPSGNYSADA